MVAGGQVHLGTSEALGAVTIPADSPVVATIEFAGAADVDYAVQAATSWPATLLQALRASREIKAGFAKINDHIPIVGEMPLRNSKYYGLGKTRLKY